LLCSNFKAPSTSADNHSVQYLQLQNKAAASVILLKQNNKVPVDNNPTVCQSGEPEISTSKQIFCYNGEFCT
jgi:hypothetical protein